MIDFTTVPSDSEIDSLVNRIGGGSGAIGNQGGLVGGILNLSVYQDIVDNQSSRQIGVNGFLRQFPFALTHGNQSVVAVASDNAATNTLDALDSLVDASGKDLDLLTISVSGANNLQSATISNFETISFALNNYNGTLVSSTVGINPTGVDDFLVTGTLSLGNQVIIDGTNNNAERINASGTTAPHIRPVYEVPSWGATDALTSSFVLTADANGSALTGADGEDTLIGGAGDDTMTGGGGADLFIISEGANTILDFGVGGGHFLRKFVSVVDPRSSM